MYVIIYHTQEKLNYYTLEKISSAFKNELYHKRAILLTTNHASHNVV